MSDDNFQHQRDPSSQLLPKPVAKLLKVLDYQFKDTKLLWRALTHSSATSGKGSYERIEFLGDAVLDLIISEALFKLPQNFSEGKLSRIRSNLVSEPNLAELARKIDIGPAIIMSEGERKAGGQEREALLADCLESIIGAIFMDGGYEATKKVVLKVFGSSLGPKIEASLTADFKTKLQEFAQAKFQTQPEYQLVSKVGPAHDYVFEVEVVLNRKVLGRGKGKTKKRASQKAAEVALSHIKNEASIFGETEELS